VVWLFGIVVLVLLARIEWNTTPPYRGPAPRDHWIHWVLGAIVTWVAFLVIGAVVAFFPLIGGNGPNRYRFPVVCYERTDVPAERVHRRDMIPGIPYREVPCTKDVDPAAIITG
jgi:hypothetical protein